MEQFSANLNNMQREAVLQTEGPLLIIAGAGSGKTTVLVNRIAHIMSVTDARPWNILAITFTNKAAGEMRDRIHALMGEDARDMWIGTFHSMCLRILRRYIDRLGYEKSFVIYDTDDAKTIIKQLLKQFNIDEKNFPIRSVLAQISKAKDEMIDEVRFAAMYEGDYRMQTIAKLYTAYQKILRENNAVDFDDIIMLSVKILCENKDALEYYANQFRYILADEYQDTNNAQYMLLSLLASKHRNLCVVGDDDQSIYKFRGANIKNILNFEKEFPECRVIKLEQNYRSTQTILNVANEIIQNNAARRSKTLWTENGEGEKVILKQVANEHEEGQYIAGEIQKLVGEGFHYSDCVVLQRTNAQSRVLEEMFLRAAIPYRVLGGTRFYDRKEIRDITAYLRLIHNPSDSASLRRIINEPKRSIGSTTVQKIADLSVERDLSMFEVAKRAGEFEELIKAEAKLAPFCRLIEGLAEKKDSMPMVDFLEKVMTDTGYIESLKLQHSIEAETRIENLKEFLSVAKEYDAKEENPTLAGFLEGISLVADIDNYDENEDSVVLMTMHSAKGLEFPVVFLAGMEDGLFPSFRSVSSDDLEEERRLCYVAVTRAKQKLYMTYANNRILFGASTHNFPSRFIKEIPPCYIDERLMAPRPKKEDIRAKREAERLEEFNRFKHSIFDQAEDKGAGAGIDYKAGERVEHRKFGKGTIISVMPMGNDAKLEIQFEEVGVKNLMAVHAKLTKIDD